LNDEAVASATSFFYCKIRNSIDTIIVIVGGVVSVQYHCIDKRKAAQQTASKQELT
jgi:hypothetical protein